MKKLRHLIDEIILLPQSAEIGLHPTEHCLVVRDGGKVLDARIELPVAEWLIRKEEKTETEPDFSFSEWEKGMDTDVRTGGVSCYFQSETADVSVEDREYTINLHLECDEDSDTIRFWAVLGDWLNGLDDYQWLRRSGIVKDFYDDLVAGKLFAQEKWKFEDFNRCGNIPLVKKWSEHMRLFVYTVEHSLATAWLVERLTNGGVSFWEEKDETP